MAELMRKRWQRATTLALLGGLLLPSMLSSVPALAQEASGAGESTDIALTVYNQNFALVKDKRPMELKAGVNYIRLEDVAATIDPTSVSFQSLTAPNSVIVREQNYEYDLLDPETVLSKSVGKQVKFTQYLPGGQAKDLSGILLNSPRVSISDVNGNVSERSVGMILKTADGVVLNPQGQVQMAEMPQGLVSKPSLLWKLETSKPGTHATEVSYQASGVNWRCDYVSVVNQDDTQADLNAWVTIDNKSGATYKNAALKLLAGDVHRVQPPVMQMEMANDAMTAGAPAMAPQFQEQSFAEYHLYALQGKTTVANNQTKQLSLFNAENVPVKKLFIVDSESPVYYPNPNGEEPKQKVQVKLEVANTQANHMGMPMPKGKVRVYKKDNDGALQFIGEDEIDHTPRDEKVRLYIGDAFDLVAQRRQVSMNQVSNHVQRASYEMELRNHKDSAATVTVVEHSWGDWTILNSNLPYVKKSTKTFEFSVPVPARGTAKVTYEIELHY